MISGQISLFCFVVSLLCWSVHDLYDRSRSLMNFVYTSEKNWSMRKLMNATNSQIKSLVRSTEEQICSYQCFLHEAQYIFAEDIADCFFASLMFSAHILQMSFFYCNFR